MTITPVVHDSTQQVFRPYNPQTDPPLMDVQLTPTSDNDVVRLADLEEVRHKNDVKIDDVNKNLQLVKEEVNKLADSNKTLQNKFQEMQEKFVQLKAESKAEIISEIISEIMPEIKSEIKSQHKTMWLAYTVSFLGIAAALICLFIK
jgi:DNA repair ATPase RecN